MALGVVVLAWGVQAIVTQSLLLREAMVLLSGNEFAWGTILFAWLLGVSGGSTTGGLIARRVERSVPALVIVLTSLGIGTCIALWCFREARAWLGVAPGELLPLLTTGLAAMVFAAPIGGLVGLAFPLACRIAQFSAGNGVAGAGPLARVYALESAGSLIGGALFTFWAVEYLSPIETALACAGLTIVACGLLLRRVAGRRIAGPVLIALGLGAWAVAAGTGADLHRLLVQRRWHHVAPGYDLVAETDSRYQNLAVGCLAGQYTLYSDGQVCSSFPDPYTFAPSAHFWMCQHPNPRRVLVLGGGAEGLLAELLHHPVERIDYVEVDPRQTELIEPLLADVDRAALVDPRVNIHHVDARHYVKLQENQFDLVIARLPEPTSAQRARYYTSEFYAELRRAMSDRAVLATAIAAAPGELSEASGTYLGSVVAALGRHFPQVVVGWGDPAQTLAATADGLVSTDPQVLMGRYLQRGVKSPYFRAEWFDGATDWLDPPKLARRAADLGAVRNIEISTDLRPIVYMQRLVLWDRMTGGRSGRLIGWLRTVHWTDLLPFLFVGMLAPIGWTLIRNRGARVREPHWRRTGLQQGSVITSVGTTGFVTMALSLTWLFAFQNLYGYVYQRIGWIIAVFMGGLVLGCALADRLARRIAPQADLLTYLWRRLIAVDLLLAALASSIPLVLPRLAAMQHTRLAFAAIEWVILSLVVLTGILGGAGFALAGGLRLAGTGEAGRAAGSVVGADHAGACLGALLTGILLVPVFGIPTTALLLAGIKLGAVALLLGTGPLGATDSPSPAEVPPP